MGSGASNGAKAKKAPGSEGIQGAALKRRRRIFFRSEAPRQFESVPPRQQYVAVPEEVDDPVFSRIPGGRAEADDIRRKCEAAQYWHDEGYLGEQVIDILGLGLMPGTPLSRRLFRVAQSQQIAAGQGPRRAQLTCYEFLALYAVLRGGTNEELLELLFCVFDADGDDKVGAEDLAFAIEAFLQLQEATAGLAPDELKDFKKIDAKQRKAEAMRIAELAVRKYGLDESEAEHEDKEEEANDEEENLEEKQTKVYANEKQNEVKDPGEIDSSGKVKKLDDDGSDDDLLEKAAAASDRKDSSSNASNRAEVGEPQTAEAKPKAKPKAKPTGLAGLCFSAPKGKETKEDSAEPSAEQKEKKEKKEKTSGKDDETSSDDDALLTGTAAADPKAKAKAKSKVKKGGLCSSAPKDDTSASEAEAEAKKKETKAAEEAKAKAKAKAEAKAKAKAKAKSKSGQSSPFCFLGGAKKAPLLLSFQQWTQWLIESELLPEGLAESVALMNTKGVEALAAGPGLEPMTKIKAPQTPASKDSRDTDDDDEVEDVRSVQMEKPLLTS